MAAVNRASSPSRSAAQQAGSVSLQDGVEGLAGAAGQGSLPSFQYVDREMVSWIAVHRPEFAVEQIWDVPRVGLPVADVAVPGGWLVAPAMVDSAHGVRHLMRAAVYAALLAVHCGLGRDACVAAAVAGAVHDCRRLHDLDDPGHGARAAAWLRQNSGMVVDHFGLGGGLFDVDLVATAVELHEVPYELFDEVQVQRYGAVRDVVDVVKTADALDRYRLPRLAWWPREEHLRLTPPTWLKALAYRLVLRSEASHVFGVPSDRSVAAALAQEGIV